MTGGIIPLAATLASDAVFKAFIGDSKVLYCLQIADIFGTWLCLCVAHVYKHSNHVLSTHLKDLQVLLTYLPLLDNALYQERHLYLAHLM